MQPIPLLIPPFIFVGDVPVPGLTSPRERSVEIVPTPMNGSQKATVKTSQVVDATRRTSLPWGVGDWELVQFLADSEQSEVFAARPRGDGTHTVCEYVVKVLRETLADDPAAVARFHREVCAGGKVNHKHLMPVVEAHLAAATDEIPSYLVMPLVAGSTLDRTLLAERALGWGQACWFARQTAQALGYLHAEGWLHADVKPANILVSADGHVTLLDLGFLQPLAETRLPRDRATSQSGLAPQDGPAPAAVLGTLKYVAPEMLVRTTGVTAASDIYSLGVVLFESLAGSHPFAEACEEQAMLRWEDVQSRLVEAHRATVPVDVRQFAPAVPVELAELVQAMLAKDPLRRPANMSQVVGQLTSLEFAALRQSRVCA